jgi:hypothetical protein
MRNAKEVAGYRLLVAGNDPTLASNQQPATSFVFGILASAELCCAME